MNLNALIYKHRERCILTAFLAAALLLRIIYIGKVHGPIVYADEMGYWGHAANMTGNTWAGVMNGMPWYACGYSFVLWPIFILQSDMSTMYRMAVILNAVLGIMSFLLAYKIIKKVKFASGSVLLTAIMSFTVTSYSAYVFHTYVAWSETLLSFLIWLIFYEIISLEEVPKCWKSVLLGVTVGYSYMVHNRMLAVVAAVLLTQLVLLYYKKINKVNMLWFVVPLAAVICIDALAKGILKDLVQDNVMLQQMGLHVSFSKANTLSAQISKFLQIFSLIGLKRFMINVAGQIWQMLSATYLLAGVGIFFCVKRLQEAVKKSERLSLYLLPVMSVFFTLMMTALFFIDEDYSVRSNGSSIRIDTIFYGRYNDIFVGILILMAFECLLIHAEIKYWYRNITVLGLIYLLVAIVMHCSLKGIEKVYLNIVSAISIHMFHWLGEFSVWKCTGIALAVFVICLLMSSIKLRKKIGNTMICILIVVLFLATALKCMRLTIKGENDYTQQYAEIFDFLHQNTEAGEPVFTFAAGKFAYDLQTRLVNRPVISIGPDQIDCVGEQHFIVMSEQEYIDFEGVEYDECLQEEGYMIIQKTED